MSFLKDQIRDSREEKLVFSEIRRIRQEDILKEVEEYENGGGRVPGWAGRNHKVYPSSLSFGMCLHDFFIKQASGKYQGIEDPKAKYRTEAGKYKHMEFQDIWKRSPKLYTLPSIPQEYALELIPKLLSEWPEVPVRHRPSGISGKADLILRVDDKPVLVDIKTTSLDERAWHDLKISAKYKTQLCIYAYIMNEQRYYPDPIEKIGIAFYNLSGTLGERSAERELYEEFTISLKDKTAFLLEEVARIRGVYLSGSVPDKCSYLKCRTHGKDNTEDE